MQASPGTVEELDGEGRAAAARIDEAFERLSARLEVDGLAGHDPYDGLASPVLAACARGRLARLVCIQAVKRSPVDLRSVLRIPRLPHAKGLALAASAHARVAHLDPSGRCRRLALDLTDQLAARSVPGADGEGYGYDFDVQTRWGFYRKGQPNAVATAFAADAFLDCAALGRLDLLVRAEAALRYACAELLTTGEGERWFAYYRGASTPIHNANMLLAGAIARLPDPPPSLARAAEDATAFTLRRQRPDGSWPYGEEERLAWVDGYHTAYVLEALRRLQAAFPDSSQLAALERGLDLYLGRLIDPDGGPRATLARRFPVESHAAGTAVTTLMRLAGHDPRAGRAARRVLRFALERLARPDGRFAYQLRAKRRVETAYVRWSDAHMLLALAESVVSGSGEEAHG
jgi:hypothetical protein